MSRKTRSGKATLLSKSAAPRCKRSWSASCASWWSSMTLSASSSYGSFAHGAIHAWSDLDLCVIKRTEKRFIERLEEVGLLTLPCVGCQILVYTPQELEAVRQQGHYFFVDEILGKGKVLYEKGKALSADRRS